jgi:MFS family permease
MKHKRTILFSLLLAAFVINLEVMIVNVALPTLVRQMHATNSQLQWVIDAYNLVFASFVLAAGGLSDRLGRKGMLLAGLAATGAVMALALLPAHPTTDTAGVAGLVPLGSSVPDPVSA